MKYCIYAGAIYKVVYDSGKLLSLSGVLGKEMVLQDQVVEMAEELYLQVKDEYEEAVKELFNIEHRLWRLNEEYHKKHTVLTELRADAGRKEKTVISGVLKKIKQVD